MKQKVLVSACLLGEASRYDGGTQRCDNQILRRWVDEGRVVSVCPEVAGGLPIPRAPAEIRLGAGGEEVIEGRARVVNADGLDVSRQFIAGAEQALEHARSEDIRVAVLKERSPSCGSSRIHDGSFKGNRMRGVGVTTALLRKAGVRVFNEEQLPEAERLLEQLEEQA